MNDQRDGDAPDRNTRVLIVDDEPAIHDDFREMLRRPAAASTDALAAAFLPTETRPEAGFDLRHVQSGESAFEAVRDANAAGEPIAVAYVDIRMPPGMDGVATIRAIRTIDPHIELVVMTAHSDRTLPEIAEGIAPKHKLLFIRKPFSRDEIRQTTTALVEKYDTERRLAARERDLATGNRRLQAILGATGEALAMFDVEGRVAFANRRYEELCGAEPGALDARTTAEADPGLRTPGTADLPDAYAGFGDELLEHGGDDARVFRHLEHDVADADGEPMGRLHVYRDVSLDIRTRRMEAEVRRLQSERESAYAINDTGAVVDSTPGMRQVFALVERAARGDMSVLIRGESGTGKELVARALHFSGPREAGPFRAVNCAALPEALVENELFGHERGAFTGADRRQLGAFEQAAGGSLFLDEIGDMPSVLQAKLLRVLQERVVQRLGGTEPVAVDVQVICATNMDLEAAMSGGTFREDLYYRIAGFPITVPPLRERRGDIPILAMRFLETQAERAERDIAGIADDAFGALLAHDWPGNVRELENTIARAVLMEQSHTLTLSSLHPLDGTAQPPPAPDGFAGDRITPLKDLEQRAVTHALAVSGNNVSQAARALGIDRVTLHRKLKRMGLRAAEGR